ncbi:unnamed protein product [Cuscuta epithymum]|uniref:UBA domain-containing protein n=1 Tax=Cuscuta epithymum TaxID=186058 RepID=A0AAV0FC77_9ASTE|nr:unnamed protein product [Cuscuta epithymum]CAH9133209.1 unnamed protein product [Cuscuta epithymum]
MSPASRKSKDKKSGKEPPKTPSKSLNQANLSGGTLTSGYNPILGTFHALDSVPGSSASSLHANGRFKNIDETDDQSSNSFGNGGEYDSVSNNGSWSGESEDHKEKTSHPPTPKQETVPGADNDKREKIRQKNEKKHQRQKERRAQELHEKCSGYLMSRKLESLAQQLVAMGFSSERATMALILNEGRVEESVAWLFEEGEEADNNKRKEHKIDGGGGNLKIDISDELSRITDIESRYKCSKQEVERVVVACEGDLNKAEETLRAQKQDTANSVQSKPDETSKPPLTTSNQISTILSAKPAPLVSIQQRKDEKIPNTSIDPAGKSIQQSSKGIQPKTEWVKPAPPAITPSPDKRWPSAIISNASSYNSLTTSQTPPPPAVMVTSEPHRYIAVGNELKNLQLGSIKEPVIVMQRPQQQSINAKQQGVPPSTIVSSSPPGGGGWYLHGVEPMKPDGMVTHVPGMRNPSHDSFSTSNQLLFSHHHYLPQQYQNVSSNGGAHESPGISSRGNSIWSSRTGGSTFQPHTVAAASSLGLFSGLGSHSPLGPPSPHVDWNSGFSVPHLDYNTIDWSLGSNFSSSAPSGGLWSKMNPPMQNNHQHHTFPPGRVAMGPILSDGISIPTRLQEGMGSAVETSAGGVSREWTSPFEEKDLFSLPRQFVSSPSL